MSSLVKVYSPIITKDDPKYESIPKFPLVIHSVGYPWREPNGYFPWIKEEVFKWCRKYLDDDGLYNKQVSEDWGGYGNALTFRLFLSKERLLNGSKLILTSIVLDDFFDSILDKTTGKYYAEKLKRFNNYLTKNRYDSTDSESPNEDIFRMYGDAVQLMKDTGLTDFQLRRLMNAADIYMDENYNTIEKKCISINESVMDINEWIIQRRRDSFMEIAYVTGEYVSGIEIDEQTFNDERVKNLYTLASDIAWGTNDIASYARELVRDGTGNNFISVYSAVNNVSIDEAHTALVKLCKDNDAKFQRSLKEITKSPLVLQCPDLVILCKYIFPDITYGVTQWSEMTGRYRANGNTLWEIENLNLTFEEQMKILGKTYID